MQRIRTENRSLGLYTGSFEANTFLFNHLLYSDWLVGETQGKCLVTRLPLPTARHLFGAKWAIFPP